jgi:hypothetical protein
MSSERNKRRLEKKAKNRHVKKIVDGMNPLQRFVLKSLKDGTVTVQDILEMSRFYLLDEEGNLKEELVEKEKKSNSASTPIECTLSDDGAILWVNSLDRCLGRFYKESRYEITVHSETPINKNIEEFSDNKELFYSFEGHLLALFNFKIPDKFLAIGEV